MSDLFAPCALIPAYRAEATVGAVVRGSLRHVPRVLVVDDGSPDRTSEAAREAGAEVLRLDVNGGKGTALRAGLDRLLARGDPASAPTHVALLDADGQHDPDEIPRFLAAYERDHPGLIVGRRDFREMPAIRRLSNTIGGWALSTAVGQGIPDNQSGFRLVGRPLMRALLDSDESGFEFEVEMIARCIALGLPVGWVPISTIYAGEPSHIRPWRHFTEFVRVTRQARRIVRGG